MKLAGLMGGGGDESSCLGPMEAGLPTNEVISHQ